MQRRQINFDSPSDVWDMVKAQPNKAGFLVAAVRAWGKSDGICQEILQNQSAVKQHYMDTGNLVSDTLMAMLHALHDAQLVASGCTVEQRLQKVEQTLSQLSNVALVNLLEAPSEDFSPPTRQ